jgi:hypothetical protein
MNVRQRHKHTRQNAITPLPIPGDRARPSQPAEAKNEPNWDSAGSGSGVVDDGSGAATSVIVGFECVPVII